MASTCRRRAVPPLGRLFGHGLGDTAVENESEDPLVSFGWKD